MKRLLAAALILSFLAGWRASAQAGDDWGNIKGRITWGGAKIPAQVAIQLPAGNPSVNDCLKANKGMPPPDESFVVNKENKGMKNVFVWLVDPEDPKQKKPLKIHPSLQPLPKKPLEIDQPACHFIPQALALREGQVLLVKNSASFAHNFKYTGNPLTKNSGNPLMPPGSSVEIDNLQADRLPVLLECNIHPWMRGYMRVFNHPYFAVTDENGAFEFKNAPAGTFRLMVWHGASGWKGGVKGREGDPVDIKAGASTDLGNLAFPPPAD